MSAAGASLAEDLAARIRRTGPMPLDAFMEACAAVYYAKGDVFGTDGDFITAPEISQTFGEIVGLWCAATWQALGAPRSFRLVECGPGRGTLMSDMLRATAKVPGFQDAARLHLVERSATLRSMQRAALKGRIATWHDDIADVPEGFSLIVANEFLDALPIRQWEKTARGWIERAVGLDESGAFVFAPGAARDLDIPLSIAADAPAGAIFETSPAALAWTRTVAARVANTGGAALAIDYGHVRTAIGETLQAVKAHRYHPPLADPGAADMTAHVDFMAAGTAAREMGARVFGPVEQGTWLARLGIGMRSAKLSAGRDEATARAIQAGVRRLTAPDRMGLLFKVMAITHPALAACEGFTQDAPP